MNIIEAIDLRKSRRTYCSEPISQAEAALLRSRVEEYNLRSGLTIRFMKGPSEETDLEEKTGYYGELLVLEATALGLGTCWAGATFEASAIRHSARERLICVITVGITPPSASLKERLIYKAIHRKTKPIEAMLETDRDMPEWIKKGMRAVQKAPSTRNTQKVKFLYESGVLRASVPETGKFDLVDLGIAKLHFALAAGGRFEPGNGGVYIPSR